MWEQLIRAVGLAQRPAATLPLVHDVAPGCTLSPATGDDVLDPFLDHLDPRGPLPSYVVPAMEMDTVLGNDVAAILRATAAATHQPRGAGSGPRGTHRLRWASTVCGDPPPRPSMAPSAGFATARFVPEPPPEAPAPLSVVRLHARVVDEHDLRRGAGTVVGFPDNNNAYARVMFKLPRKMTVNVLKNHLRRAPTDTGC